MYAFSFAVMKREQYNKVDLWVEPPPHSMHSATNDFLEKLKQLASKENNLRQHTYHSEFSGHKSPKFFIA